MFFMPILRYKRTFIPPKMKKYNWITAISTSNCDKYWKLLYQLKHNTWINYKSLIYYCVLHLICQMKSVLCVFLCSVFGRFRLTIVSFFNNFQLRFVCVCSTNVIVAIILYDDLNNCRAIFTFSLYFPKLQISLALGGWIQFQHSTK